MSNTRSAVAALSLLSILNGMAAAQDPETEEPPASGPATGRALPKLNVSSVSGASAGTEFDLAARLGAAPCAILFIHELTRETAPVIRELDRMQAEYGVLGLQTGTVLLSGDRTEGERRLGAVNRSLRLSRPIVLSLDGLEGPGDYALNRTCALTLVMAKEGKVVGCRSFVDTGEKDAARVRTAVESVTGPIPDDPAELKRRAAAALPDDPDALRRLALEQALEIRRLQQRLNEAQERNAGMRAGSRPGMRPAERQQTRDDSEPKSREGGDEAEPDRRGGPPDDAELQTLLRRFIRKDATDVTIDEVLQKIEARAAVSDDLREQTRQMFLLMLSYPDRYGTPRAQEAARQYLSASDEEDEGSKKGEGDGRRDRV